MKLSRKSLLYDISNLAFTIADTGDNNRHSLHQVRDICEDGNIDRVNAVLHLAFSKVVAILSRPRKSRKGKLNTLPSEECKPTVPPDDFQLHIKLPPEMEFNLKETIREYLVCCVLADWLAITLPEAADVWKFRAEACFSALQELIAGLSLGSTNAFTRKVTPI